MSAIKRDDHLSDEEAYDKLIAGAKRIHAAFTGDPTAPWLQKKWDDDEPSHADIMDDRSS